MPFPARPKSEVYLQHYDLEEEYGEKSWSARRLPYVEAWGLRPSPSDHHVRRARPAQRLFQLGEKARFTRELASFFAVRFLNNVYRTLVLRAKELPNRSRFSGIMGCEHR